MIAGPTRALALAAAVLAAGAFARPGAMHNRLTASLPAADSTVTKAPAAIRLWFAERPEPALSRIALEGPGGKAVRLGKVEKTDDPLSIRAAVLDAMGPGSYTVKWRASGKDGHVISGSFTFLLQP